MSMWILLYATTLDSAWSYMLQNQHTVIWLLDERVVSYYKRENLHVKKDVGNMDIYTLFHQ